MPLWNVDIEKSMSNEYWTNRYIVDAADRAAAAVIAAQIIDVETAIHRDVVTLTKARVSDMVPGTDNYVIIPINAAGELASVSGDMLPLFNVVRVDFGTDGGRPSRKYLRLPLYKADINGDSLASGFLGSMNSIYAGPMLAIDEYVDVDGQPFLNATVSLKVGMRQLRRGSKRKLVPVLPEE